MEPELELSQNHVPISTTDGPVFDNFPAGQIKHLAQGIVVGEPGFIFGDLAELAVQALDDIGRVYDFPNLGGICEKGTNLSALQSLNVSRNRLTELPEDIGNLSALQSLDVAVNKLTTIPDGIGKLSHLKKLLLGQINNLAYLNL